MHKLQIKETYNKRKGLPVNNKSDKTGDRKGFEFF